MVVPCESRSVYKAKVNIAFLINVGGNLVQRAVRIDTYFLMIKRFAKSVRANVNVMAQNVVYDAVQSLSTWH